MITKTPKIIKFRWIISIVRTSKKSQIAGSSSSKSFGPLRYVR